MRTRATFVLHAEHVDVGDLVVGPDLPAPRRVLWRCPFTSPEYLRFELSGNLRLLVGPGDPLLLTARPQQGDPEWQLRYGCGLAGAAAERRMLLGGLEAPVRDELLARVDRAAAAWAGQLGALTGEDPALLLRRYRTENHPL